MKNLWIVLVVVPFLAVAGCKAAATPQSKEIVAIDKELADNNNKMKALSPASDEYERLRDRNIELNAERSNVIQRADKNRRSGNESGE